MMKNNDKLTSEQWEELVRGFLKKLLFSITKNRGDSVLLAKAIDKSMSFLAEMKSSGAGTVVTWIRVMAYKAGLSDKKAQQLLENPVRIFRNIEPPSLIEELFAKVKARYSEDEIIGWLKLLLTKFEIEDKLGLTIRVASKKTSKKSNVVQKSKKKKKAVRKRS